MPRAFIPPVSFSRAIAAGLPLPNNPARCAESLDNSSHHTGLFRIFLGIQYAARISSGCMRESCVIHAAIAWEATARTSLLT